MSPKHVEIASARTGGAVGVLLRLKDSKRPRVFGAGKEGKSRRKSIPKENGGSWRIL